MITADASEITFSSGTVLVSGVNAIVVDSTTGQLYLSGGIVRVKGVIIPSGSGITFSSGAVTTGSNIGITVAHIFLYGGQPTVASLLAATGAEIDFSGGEPVVANGPTTAGAQIAISSGTTLLGDALAPVAGEIVISGGELALGDGIATDVALLAFSGGTVVLADGIKAPSVTIWLTGGVMPEVVEAAQGTVVVLNANTLAVSEYSLSALDVFEHEGKLYFVQADGLVKLDAAGDEVVTSFMQTGDLTLAPDASANVAYAYVEKAADGAMTLTATADQDGKARTVAYAMPLNFPEGKARVSHVKLGRGVLGNAWSFKIGATGTAWSVAGLSIGVDRIRRRQR